MLKEKTKLTDLPPIDLNSDEWIYFDYRNNRIYRNVQLGVSQNIDDAMPPQIASVRLRRLDTSEIINKPISYCHTLFPKLRYHDSFLGCEVFVETRCEFADPIQQPKKPKRASKTNQPKAKESNNESKHKSGFLF